MTDPLQSIVEEIGILADRAESDKWQVAEQIAVAFAEFPAYTRGLTLSLCERLRRSTDSIYGYRDAWELRSLLNVSDSLTVSHYSTLAHLRTRYDLSVDECKDWAAWAEENNIHVRELNQEVTAKHTEDALKQFMRHVAKLGKLVERIWQDCESVGLSETKRAVVRAALGAVREMVKILEGK